MLIANSYAKINLTLEVLGNRNDGYHDICSIVQTLDLHDTITFTPSNDIELQCDQPKIEPSKNLVLKAAELLKKETGCKQGARISLHKKIPLSAGLGGGSSNAATTLKNLNLMWGTDLSPEELCRLSTQIGSDVPFFLHGGTAIIRGRGERVFPLPAANLKWIVILTPNISLPLKTTYMYSNLTSAQHTKGLLTKKMETCIRSGKDIPTKFLFNTFDKLAIESFPGLFDYRKTFLSLGTMGVHITGSGPSLFSHIHQKEQATQIDLILRERYGWESYLVKTWQPPKNKQE